MTTEESIWSSYLDQEDGMKDFLRYVPWEEAHGNVWSPKLADLLLVVGSSIDSSFQAFVPSAYLNDVEGIEEVRRKKEAGRLNIGDFLHAFSPVYPLAEYDVVLRMTGGRLSPWQGWVIGSEGKGPEWWTAYNEIKHHKFEAIRQATLGTTMSALGGFLQVCSVILEIRALLMSLGNIRYIGDKVPQGFGRILQTPDPQKNHLGFTSPIWVETELFTVPLYRTGVWMPP